VRATSVGGVYEGVGRQASLEVDVRDADTGDVLVTETGGSTIVAEGSTDTYTLQLTMAPTHDVVVTVLTDGQTIATADDPDDPGWQDEDGNLTVTFGPDDWDVPFTVRLTVIPTTSATTARSRPSPTRRSRRTPGTCSAP
jgi:hypothetical protein